MKPAVSKRRPRSKRARLLEQQAALAALTSSEVFNNENVQEALQLATETAARLMGVERVSLWRYRRSRASIVCIDLYEQIADRHSSGAELEARRYPAYFDALATNEAIVADDAPADPRTQEFRSDYLTPLGITAMLDIPVHVHGRVDGVLCHEQVGAPAPWTAEDRLFGIAIANLISLALEQRERKRAEEALRESEQRLATLLAYAPAAIITLDREGKITLFNHAAERSFRCDAAAAIGQSCERFLSAALHRIVVENCSNAGIASVWIADGHCAVRADGETFPVEASLSCAQTGDQTIYTLIVRDTTERDKLRLREMSARMQKDIEEERKRISQALHDEMGQNLAALQLDADWLRRRCQELPVVVDTVDRMQKSIDESATAMRRIIADMRPRVLDDLGVDVAIKGLVKDISSRWGIDVCFESEGTLDTMDDSIKTALYRMLQECLTNVVRHAQATKVAVDLIAGERDVVMTVMDNGRGLLPDAQSKPGSFGLFGLGERASQLGGSLAVESAPQKGTRVVVRIPNRKDGDAVRATDRGEVHAVR